MFYDLGHCQIGHYAYFFNTDPNFREKRREVKSLSVWRVVSTIPKDKLRTIVFLQFIICIYLIKLYSLCWPYDPNQLSLICVYLFPVKKIQT